MSTLWLYVLLCFRYADSAKILGFFSFPSVSHQIIFQSIWKELSLRGHKVTVITPNPLSDTSLKNLKEIDVRSAYEVLSKKNFSGSMGTSTSTLFKVFFIHDMLISITEAEIQQKSVLELMALDENHFDVILVQSLHPLMYFTGAKFRAPIIGVSSFDIFLEFHDAVGNPTHPIISPEIVYNGFDKELSFVERVKSVLFHIWYRAIYYWHILPEADKVTRKYLGEDVPYLGDVIKNTSMFLVNVNCILHKVRANVPNVIPMSQMHIRKKKPLPKDLQDYLDSSSQGVVYFSLGSNVKSANLSIHLREVIINAFEEIPYNVLWKWESDYLPDCPENVMTRKWLPQQDLLGHPNIKVFITQGGVQSLEEAIANEVPVIGLPFISDQSANVKRMMDRGAGLGLDPNTLTKDDLRNAILEVATNSQYKKQIKKAKSILLDEPLVGVEKAVWWIEYVLRHKGAPHLRSEAADMTFFEYFMVDVLAFLSICVLLASFIFIYSMRVLVKLGLSISESPKQKSA
ncbi:UDP-glycosyltransferase UGT5 isoform X2 [Leptinotarsa decemlineata]|uniref:UDP-glycosyltransferase UGT5 isoform X2 n=1 Tax=Leptinotarsa decemlineata TaxID=7539 RepID=UPI003D305260